MKLHGPMMLCAYLWLWWCLSSLDVFAFGCCLDFRKFSNWNQSPWPSTLPSATKVSSARLSMKRCLTCPTSYTLNKKTRRDWKTASKEKLKRWKAMHRWWNKQRRCQHVLAEMDPYQHGWRWQIWDEGWTAIIPIRKRWMDWNSAHPWPYNTTVCKIHFFHMPGRLEFSCRWMQCNFPYAQADWNFSRW